MNQPVNPSDFFVFSLHLLTSKTIFFNIQTSTFVQQEAKPPAAALSAAGAKHQHLHPKLHLGNGWI